MRQIDLMIFDFDGTLVDTGTDLAEAVNYTLRALGLTPCKKEEILNFVGDGVVKLIEKSLGHKNNHRYDEALRIFTDFYDVHLLDTTYLYRNVREVLEFFGEKRKVILTNKRSRYTERIAHAFDIAHHFDGIFCPDTSPFMKPDPRLVDWILGELDATCDYEKIAIIGDGVNDVLLAKNTGIVSCALLCGYTSREKLIALAPDYSCELIGDVRRLFI